MTLSDVSIRHPVFAWMLMVGLMVFGAIGFQRMGISQLPDVDFPVLTVTVTWQGAAPEVMESAVADVIEDAVMSVDGIRDVRSTSREGISTIVLEFNLTQDINVALEEVQTKIAQAQRTLPTDIDPPVVTKTNPEDQPILWTAISGSRSLREMVLFVRDVLRDNLTTVNGVGDVFLGGYVDPNMRIWLFNDELRRLQIAVDDVIAAVTSEHILVPSGYMDNGPKETNVRAYSEARNAREFDRMVIPSRRGEPIWRRLTIGDVAQCEEGLNDIRRISRKDGALAVGLGIVKQRGTNAVAVGNGVKERLRALASLLPQGMIMGVVTDATKFIEQSTHELLLTLTLSVLLTSAVCWLFLGSWSSAVNVILAIPTSLLGTFIVLYFMGFTLNTFTLLGLSLSVGIVVDDAIMVLENIVRHNEAGQTRVEAAILGARQITTAAVASSLAILAIFLPVVFMQGIIGRFFFQFGVTMASTVLLSLLEALTLTPMRCSQFLQVGGGGPVARSMDRLMGAAARAYRRALEAILRHPWRVLMAATALFLASLLTVRGARREFVPPQDQSRFLVTIYAPIGSSMAFTDGIFREAETIMKSRPEVETYYLAIGGFGGGLVNQGIIFITLKDPGRRPVAGPFRRRPSQQEFMGFIRGRFKGIPGVERVILQDLSLTGFTAQRGFPIEFTIQGPGWDRLAALTGEMMKRMAGSGLMTDIDTDYQSGMPELGVYPDRAKAAARGVTVTTIADAVSAMIGGLRIGKYTDATGHRDDIRVKLVETEDRTPTDVTRIWVRNNQGEMVPLSKIVTLQEKPSLLQITRYDRQRAISVFANIAAGKSQADALAFVESAGKSLLPPGYHVVLSGSSQTFRESFRSLLLALVLGIFVAYMVLASQFDSFLHPWTILLALPFSVTGAFLALRLTGISLNIYSMIGLLLLMGIVKKNSILLVDFTNQRRDAGLGVDLALLEACPIRLRPIVMTSAATVAAAVPAALALGPGAELMRPMAVVVIGGVTVSTLLTLFVVPCAYKLMSRLESHRHEQELKEAIQRLGR